jgi:hypothetical protein
MKRSSRPTRTPANLSESVRQQLNMYAVAASAAGVGMLALSQPAEAKIIYTPAHVVIPPGLAIGFDVTHDGFDDFQINNFYRVNNRYHTVALDAWGNFKGDAVAGVVNYVSSTSYAYALLRGAKIGPSIQFSGINMLATSYYGGVFGKWDNVRDRYLGLQLQIKGKIHYGWARLNVSFVMPRISAVLTGYAYETIPNKPIIAGRTKGPDDTTVEESSAALGVPTPEPATLGALAMGAPGLSIWRREERRSHLDA